MKEKTAASVLWYLAIALAIVTFNEVGGLGLARAADVWTPRENDRLWFSVASSADGHQLVAVEHEGRIYTSSDAGVTWFSRESVRTWYTVASSSDGNKLAAVIGSANDFVYTSTDGGVSWTPRGSSGNRYGIACSDNGARLITHNASGNNSNGLLNSSDDAGKHWVDVDFPGVWRSFASSADGSTLIAANCPGRNCGNNGEILISTDFGATWTQCPGIAGSFVASSANGNKLVAAGPGGPIYTSTDAGANWTARETNRNWKGVASSADGTKLVAVVYGGRIYVSTDSGATWTEQESDRNWSSVASSADGSRLVATVAGGQIYTFGPPLCQPQIFQGFLAPIGGADETGGTFDVPVKTFKVGSRIPVRFSLLCDNSPVLEGVHTLQVIPYTTATVPGIPIDATPDDPATTGTVFLLSGNEWRFNLDTKALGMSIGIWRFEATLADGTVHFAWVQLK